MTVQDPGHDLPPPPEPFVDPLAGWDLSDESESLPLPPPPVEGDGYVDPLAGLALSDLDD